MGTFYKTVQDRKKRKERKNGRGDPLQHLPLQQQKIMSKIVNLRRYIGWDQHKEDSDFALLAPQESFARHAKSYIKFIDML